MGEAGAGRGGPQGFPEDAALALGLGEQKPASKRGAGTACAAAQRQGARPLTARDSGISVAEEEDKCVGAGGQKGRGPGSLTSGAKLTY